MRDSSVQMNEEVDDRTLMIRFQDEGDEAAFTQIFERHKDRLKAFLARLAGNQHIAEEISQRVWVKVLEVAERRGYRPQANTAFATYLFTLARNAFLDEYRKHLSRELPLASPEGPSPAGVATNDPADGAASAQLHEVLTHCLMELPLEQREVIAFWAAGMDFESIASITGVSRHTVIGRKKYAIARLRQAMDRHGVGKRV